MEAGHRPPLWVGASIELQDGEKVEGEGGSAAIGETTAYGQHTEYPISFYNSHSHLGLICVGRSSRLVYVSELSPSMESLRYMLSKFSLGSILKILSYSSFEDCILRRHPLLKPCP